MSQQIENQIVKMQFDNASFEKNVEQSMSTLDKLKKALKFDKVDMSPLQKSLDNVNVDNVSSACDAVTKKFSLLGTIGDQIIRDLTSKFTSAAEKMVKSFTVDQVASGWNKYAEKTTAVQTIMANTIKDVGEGLKWADQAEQMEAVTKQIEKLNWFTDETSYSLTDMTSNIGKFVAQSVGLEDATKAMMGISTWAAVSGQNKTQAQMAMYNLSQSLGAGAVKAIDWKSIENANMATAEFKETVIETAKALGVLDEKTGAINEAYITAAKYNGPDAVTVANFRDTLSAGWFNTDVLMGTLEKYGGFSEKINELYNLVNRNGMASTTSGLLKIIDAVGKGSEGSADQVALLAKNADMATEDLMELINELNKPEYDLGKRAFAAAQEAKTFQEAIDATSDAVASEWMGIFEAIFGNYLEAKELWTDLANSLWDIFAAPLDNVKWALIEWKDAEIEVFDATEGEYKTLKGRELLLNAFTTALTNIGEAIEVVRSALAEVFPIFNLFVTEGEDAFDTSEGAEGILRFTKALKGFADSLKLSEDAANSLHTIVRLLATGVKTSFSIVGGFFQGIFKLVKPVLNIADAIFGLIGKIIAALTGNDTIIGFTDKLASGAGKVKSTYLAVMDKVAAVLNKIADAIRKIPDSTLFSKISQGVKDAKQSLENFWEAFVEMPVVQQMITDFNNTVEDIQRKVEPVVQSVRKAFTDLKTNVKTNFNLTTLNNILTKVYNKLKDFMTLIKNFTTRVKDFFTGLKNGKSIVQSFKDSFGDIVERVKELKDNLMTFFKDIFEKGDELGGKFNLQAIQQAIHDFVTNITPEQVTMIAVATTFGLIALNMLRLSEALKNAVDSFTGIGLALKKVIESYIKKQKSTILQIAEAIVIVAASLWVLSTIPKEKLENAIDALITLTVCLGGLTLVLTACGIAMHKLGGEKSMVELASALAFVAGSFMIAALSLKVLEYVNLEGILPKLAVMAGVMVALSLLSLLIGKLDKFGKGSLTMVAVSASLLIAAEAMRRIGEIPEGTLDKSLDAMFKMMVGLAAIVFAANRVGIFSAVGLIAIVLTLDKLLPALEKIVNYDYTGIENGLKKNERIMTKLGGLMLILVGIGMIAGNRIKGAGIAMVSFAATFAIMVGICKLVGMLKPQELRKGEQFLWSMAGIIALLELCSSKSRLGMFGGKNGGEGTKALIRIATTMGILLGIAKLASMMEWRDLLKGEVALLGLSVIVKIMLEVAKDAQKTEGVIKSVSMMIFAISFILAEVALLSMIPLGKMLPALGAILGIILSLAVLARAISSNIKIYEKGKFKTTGAMVIISALVLVGALGFALWKVSQLAPKNVAAAAGGIVGIVLALSVMMKALSKVNGKDFSMKQLQTFAGAVVMLFVISALLGVLTAAMQKFNLDPNTMVKSAAAIAIVLLGLVPVLAILNKFSTYTGKGSAVGKYEKMLQAVKGAVILLAGVAFAIGALNRFGGNPETMLKSAEALSLGLLAICVPLVVLAGVGKFVQKINGKGLAGVVIGAIASLASVAAAIIVISNMTNPDHVIKSAQALAIGLLAISVPIAVLGAVGLLCSHISTVGLGGMAIAAVGAILAMATVAAVLVNFAKSINTTELEILNGAIPVLATAIGGVAILALAIAAAGLISGGNFAVVLAGGLAMIEAIAIFALVVEALVALGWQLNTFTNSEKYLKDGLDMLVVIAGKLGEAAGALISGFGVGVTKDLPTIADNMIAFSEKMKTFGDNMSLVNEDAVKGCQSMAKAVLAITAASFIEGLTRWLGIGKIEDFDFEPLGVGVAAFCKSIVGISEAAVKKASDCANIAAILAGISAHFENKGGLAGLIFGEKEDLGKFGDSMEAFGKAVVRFADALINLAPNAIELSERARDAGAPMVELSKTLTSKGGWLQAIIGEKESLGQFGESLKSFVGSLLTFVTSLVDLEKQVPNYGEVIKRCADSTAPMVDLANTIKNSGGALVQLVGDNTLDTFGNTLIPFIKDLKLFVYECNTMAKTVPNWSLLIYGVAVATNNLVTLANNLQNMGGGISKIAGDNTLDRFGETLVSFGKSLKEFSLEVKEVDILAINTIKPTIESLIGLGTLASEVPKDSFDSLTKAFDDISKMPLTKIVEEVKKGTPELATAVTTLFNNLALLVNLRKETDAKTYIGYGKGIPEGIADGIKTLEATNKIVTAITNLIKNITDFFDEHMSSEKFETYGLNIVTGLANGITNNAETAVTAATNMATAVNEAMPKTLKENSPSKISYGYGKYYAQGFGLGIADYTGEAVQAATGMSEEVISAANDMITAISAVLDENMDTQPTIRPVLDTSDIASKARTIGRMFNGSDLALAYNTSNSMKEANEAKNAKLYSPEDTTVAPAAQISFTQNNYSPKALNQMEIYRQTKNQLSMMKGVVRANA